MSSEEKKVLLLLKAIIFLYHGLDKDEEKILYETADKLGAREELDWVFNFVGTDHFEALRRAREFFNQTVATYDKETKLSYLNTVWEATNRKGHITEMEATAMLRFAKDWGVEKDLMELIKQKQKG